MRKIDKVAFGEHILEGLKDGDREKLEKAGKVETIEIYEQDLDSLTPNPDKVYIVKKNPVLANYTHAGTSPVVINTATLESLEIIFHPATITANSQGTKQPFAWINGEYLEAYFSAWKSGGRVNLQMNDRYKWQDEDQWSLRVFYDGASGQTSIEDDGTTLHFPNGTQGSIINVRDWNNGGVTYKNTPMEISWDAEICDLEIIAKHYVEVD